jgi:hypothetical protein
MDFSPAWSIKAAKPERQLRYKGYNYSGGDKSGNKNIDVDN